MAKLHKPKLFSLMLNEEQFRALRAISEATMIPMSALVRKGIETIIEQYQNELKRDKKG